MRDGQARSFVLQIRSCGRWVTYWWQSRSLAQDCPLFLTKEASCKDCCIWWLLKHVWPKNHKEIKRRYYKWKTDLPKYINQRLVAVIDKKCQDKNHLKSAEKSGQRPHFIYSQKRKYKWWNYMYLIIQKMQMKTTVSFLSGLINQLELQVLGWWGQALQQDPDRYMRTHTLKSSPWERSWKIYIHFYHASHKIVSSLEIYVSMKFFITLLFVALKKGGKLNKLWYIHLIDCACKKVIFKEFWMWKYVQNAILHEMRHTHSTKFNISVIPALLIHVYYIKM